MDKKALTLVERMNRFTLCSRVKTRSKEEVCGAINRLFDTIWGRKKAVTLDNSGEFVAHTGLSVSVTQGFSLTSDSPASIRTVTPEW